MEPVCNLINSFSILIAPQQPLILMEQTVNHEKILWILQISLIYNFAAVWYNAFWVKGVMEHHKCNIFTCKIYLQSFLSLKEVTEFPNKIRK